MEDYGPQCVEIRRPPRAETTTWARPVADAPANPPTEGGVVADINRHPLKAALWTALPLLLGVIIAMEKMYGALR